MMIKGVIFDFNGTLFFDEDKHVEAWSKMSIKLRNKELTIEELQTKLNGVPNHQTIEYFLNKELTLEESKPYSLMKEAMYREACLNDPKHFCLVKGVEEYFEYLKNKDIPFTIASASIKVNMDFFIESFHLDQWIEPKQMIYDNGTYKNKKQMFIDASTLLGCDISETIVFEDSMSGIKHAYEAGCGYIIVVCKKEKESQFIGLPGVIKTIEDFSDMYE